MHLGREKRSGFVRMPVDDIISVHNLVAIVKIEMHVVVAAFSKVKAEIRICRTEQVGRSTCSFSIQDARNRRCTQLELLVICDIDRAVGAHASGRHGRAGSKHHIHRTVSVYKT